MAVPSRAIRSGWVRGSPRLSREMLPFSSLLANLLFPFARDELEPKGTKGDSRHEFWPRGQEGTGHILMPRAGWRDPIGAKPSFTSTPHSKPIQNLPGFPTKAAGTC